LDQNGYIQNAVVKRCKMHKVVAYSYTRDQAHPYCELPGSLFANNVSYY